MLVVYRISGIPSTNPSPKHQDNKLALNKLCMRSFINAFQGEDILLYLLIDNATNEYYDFMADEIPFSTEIEYSQVGINQTMLRSYELAIESDEDYVLFQECDYLYRPMVGGKLIKAIKELKGMVSPYDHPNFYKDPALHSKTCDISLIGDTHFRSTERNTMTWGCSTDLVRENYDLLCEHGYLDGDVWYDLKRVGYTLYVPIPSFATHMAKDWLAPSYNWEALSKTL